MFKKLFRIKYQLKSVQTRSNPLFNKTRAYIITDSYKRLLADGLPYKNNKIQFRDADNQEIKYIVLDENKNAIQNFVTILIQFNAEGRAVKMGQVLINIADIINYERNGQVMSYKLQKSYDKNAKVNVIISIFEEGLELSKFQGQQRKIQTGIHSKSYSQLAKPKIKMRDHNNQKYNFQITDYSQISQKDIDLNENQTVSGKMNSYILQNNTMRKKDFTKMIPKQTLQRQLIDAKSENRIYQHEISSLQRKFESIQIQIDTLKQKLNLSQTENYHLNAHCQQLKKELNSLEYSKQALKEQLNIEISKFSKMYQQSQKERNKLLMQIDNINKAQGQKRKDQQKQNTDCKGRIKELQKNQQMLGRKVQEYINQLSIFDRSLKLQKKNKEKVQHLYQQLKLNLSNKQNQIKILQQQINKINSQKQQSISELQISKFSLKQFQKDIFNLKRQQEQKNQSIKRLQSQLANSQKTIKQQKMAYAKKLQEFEMIAEKQQRNMQGYLQELQIKSINEHTKNNMIANLKKDIIKLKKILQLQRQRFSELQQHIKVHLSDKQRLQSRLIHEQHKNIDLVKQKSLLQMELKKIREQLDTSLVMHPSLKQSMFLGQEQKQQLVMMCYEQRDHYWRKQFQKIQKDFKSLLQKNKKDKQLQEQSICRLQQCLEEKIALLNKKEQQYKAVSASSQQAKKQLTQLQQKLSNQQKLMSKLNEEYKKQKEVGINLKKALQNYTQLQAILKSKQKEVLSCKSQLQKGKKENDKMTMLLKKMQNDVKELTGFMNTYLMKNQKYKFYFQEFQCQTLDHQFIDIINSSFRHYCDKMNKTRVKLNQYEQLKRQAELNIKRANSKKSVQTFANEKNIEQWSFDSRISSISNQFKETPNLLSSLNLPKDTFKTQSTKMIYLQRQYEDQKVKLHHQIQQKTQLQKEIQGLNQLLSEFKQKNKKLSQINQNNNDQICELNQKLKSKQKSVQKLKQQCKQLNKEISQLKNELQNTNKALNNQKKQAFKRVGNVNRSYQQCKTDRMYDESYLKLMQIQAKYKISQDEIQRLKKEKDDKRSDNILQNRQSKLYQVKIAQKEQLINGLKKEIMQQRNNCEKLKEDFSLKFKTLKQQYQTELQQNNRAQKEQEKAYKDLQDKYRQISKKYKIIEDNSKNYEVKLNNMVQKQEKSRKLIANQWQLKLKTIKTQYQPQITALKNEIQLLRSGEKSVKEVQKRKDKQIRELIIQLQRRDITISQLRERFDNLNQRNIYLQQEQSNFKDIIKVLEDKIKEKCMGQSSRHLQNIQKDLDKDIFQSKSNFSLKTFTFK